MDKKTCNLKLGISLILASLMFFAALLVIPILDYDSEKKVIYATVSFILAEVFFYSGGFLVGKEVFNKYREYFNPKNWFKKKVK